MCIVFLCFFFLCQCLSVSDTPHNHCLFNLVDHASSHMLVLVHIRSQHLYTSSALCLCCTFSVSWLKSLSAQNGLSTHVHLHYISHMVAERGTRRISERIRERIVDTYVSQMVEQLLEVPKIIPQDRILQRTMKQIVDCKEAKRADLAKGEKSLAASMASQAVSKSSYTTQVASDHETSGRAFADELTALAEATTGAPIRDEWSRRTAVLTFTGKFKRCFADIDISQRIRTGDIGQTARRAGALNCARSARIAHFCNHEVWCRC